MFSFKNSAGFLDVTLTVLEFLCMQESQGFFDPPLGVEPSIRLATS
jgi:hypothetical protein